MVAHKKFLTRKPSQPGQTYSRSSVPEAFRGQSELYRP